MKTRTKLAVCLMTPPIQESSLIKQLDTIETLYQKLFHLTNEEKLIFLQANEHVTSFLKKSQRLSTFYRKASPEEKYVIASVLALGLGENIFYDLDALQNYQEPLQPLVSSIVELQNFYELIEALSGIQTCSGTY